MWKLILGVMIGSTSWAQTMQIENELLWEISGNGLKEKSYLYGSLHYNDKRLFLLSDSTYIALHTAKTIVLEADIFSMFKDWDTRKENVRLLYDNQGKPYTGTNKATKTMYGNEDGMPQFLDAYFLQYCYNAGKEFIALETINDQLNFANDWIEPDLKNINQSAISLTQERMMEFYVKGDITSLDRMMRANMALFPGMYDDIIVNRNMLMLTGLDTIIQKNSTFCAVGAGHLAGESGLINLLRKKGYRVRKVNATYKQEVIPEKASVHAKRIYSYSNDTIGLYAKFPGKPLETKIWDDHTFLVYREMGQGNTYSIEIVPADSSLSLEEQAYIYIASPDEVKFHHKILDDGSEVFEGLSDTYPEGLHWIRLIQNDKYLFIIKAYGGNKFMNSNRPKVFFSNVWLD